MKVSEPRQAGSMQLFDVTLPSGTTIKDCKVVDSAKGKFISGPSRSYQKDGETKWVNMVSFSKADQEAIFAALLGTAGQDTPPADDDIPF